MSPDMAPGAQLNSPLPLPVMGLDQAPPPATALDTPLAAGKLPGQTHPR